MDRSCRIGCKAEGICPPLKQLPALAGGSSLIEDGKKVLIVDTNLGATRLFIYGPFSPDLKRLPPMVDCTLKQISYSQSGIGKEIRKFDLIECMR